MSQWAFCYSSRSSEYNLWFQSWFCFAFALQNWELSSPCSPSQSPALIIWKASPPFWDCNWGLCSLAVAGGRRENADKEGERSERSCCCCGRRAIKLGFDGRPTGQSHSWKVKEKSNSRQMQPTQASPSLLPRKQASPWYHHKPGSTQGGTVIIFTNQITNSWLALALIVHHYKSQWGDQGSD